LTMSIAVCTESRFYLYSFRLLAFTLLSECFSPFPYGTCMILDSLIVFSLRRSLSPSSCSIIKEHYSISRYACLLPCAV